MSEVSEALEQLGIMIATRMEELSDLQDEIEELRKWETQSAKLAEFARRGWVIEMPTPSLSERSPHNWHGKAWRLDEIDDHSEGARIPKAKAPDEFTARAKLIEALEEAERNG